MTILTNIIYIFHTIGIKMQKKPLGNLMNKMASSHVTVMVISSIKLCWWKLLYIWKKCIRTVHCINQEFKVEKIFIILRIIFIILNSRIKYIGAIRKMAKIFYLKKRSVFQNKVKLHLSGKWQIQEYVCSIHIRPNVCI